jgi:hypothetical protein
MENVPRHLEGVVLPLVVGGQKWGVQLEEHDRHKQKLEKKHGPFCRFFPTTKVRLCCLAWRSLLHL